MNIHTYFKVNLVQYTQKLFRVIVPLLSVSMASKISLKSEARPELTTDIKICFSFLAAAETRTSKSTSFSSWEVRTGFSAIPIYLPPVLYFYHHMRVFHYHATNLAANLFHMRMIIILYNLSLDLHLSLTCELTILPQHF